MSETSPKIVLVTGATDGIGLQTATDLALAGWRVIVHGRKPERVEDAIGAIRRAAPEAPEPEGIVADLASLAAVREMAATVGAAHPTLDVLLNNAGVYEKTRRLSADGFEMTLAVNHLAHHLLTRLLEEPLRAAAPSRVVTVASVAHGSGEIDLDDLQLERGYSGYRAYSASKLANVLFSSALARREAGSGVTSNSLHPGVIGTKLLRAGFGGMHGASLESGARTSVYLATSPEVATVTGRYFSDSRETSPSRLALDETLQERLWDATERLVGL